MSNERNELTGVQFYCDPKEIATIRAAAEKDMRSVASLAKLSTLRAAKEILGEEDK